MPDKTVLIKMRYATLYFISNEKKIFSRNECRFNSLYVSITALALKP